MVGRVDAGLRRHVAGGVHRLEPRAVGEELEGLRVAGADRAAVEDERARGGRVLRRGVHREAPGADGVVVVPEVLGDVVVDGAHLLGVGHAVVDDVRDDLVGPVAHLLALLVQDVLVVDLLPRGQAGDGEEHPAVAARHLVGGVAVEDERVLGACLEERVRDVRGAGRVGVVGDVDVGVAREQVGRDVAHEVGRGVDLVGHVGHRGRGLLARLDGVPVDPVLGVEARGNARRLSLALELVERLRGGLLDGVEAARPVRREHAELAGERGTRHRVGDHVHIDVARGEVLLVRAVREVLVVGPRVVVVELEALDAHRAVGHGDVLEQAPLHVAHPVAWSGSVSDPWYMSAV